MGAAIVLSATTADPDLWGHVRFGQDIIASGSLPRDDSYSFTSDRPWINHEWLAEVLMALAFEAGGSLGLNLLRVAVIGLVLLLVWSRLKAVDGLQRVQLVAVAALGIVLRVHPIRPQLFSVLLFAVTLALITRAEERRSVRPLLVMPLVMLVWVNLHGGWIVGIGALGYWTAARMTTGTVPSDRPILAAVLGVAALSATLVNPYGTGMWAFLAETVRVQRPHIGDWQPIYTLAPAFALVWFIPVAVTAFAAARAFERIDRVHLGLVAILGVAAVRVSRLDAFFTLAAVFCFAPLLRRGTDEATRGDAFVPTGRLASAVLTAVIAGTFAVAAWRLPSIAMPPSLSPEPDAAAYVREHRLEGRMLTWFNWGEYAIWHFSPRIRVSMDGRRETVYSDAVVSEHMRFYAGAQGSLDYPDRIGADYIWLPRTAGAVPHLLARGWRAAFEGPISILLSRSDSLVAVRSTSSAPRRLFPSM